MMNYQSLTFFKPEQLMFGRADPPLRCGFDLVIGNGQVFPEVNFTLPTMAVDSGSSGAVLEQYREMVSTVLSRLVTLGVPGAVIEFEHAPQMTEIVEIGRAVTAQTKELMKQAYDEHGLRAALRTTVCDIRDSERPPKMRTGKATATMLASFRANAQAGGDLLSIESTGGKEISDRALMEGDIGGILAALGILAPRDMHFLWNEIVGIADAEGVVPAGDTACAFANTAMVLADRKYIPNVLAAVVRAMSAVRSLVAFEEGALGPSKDCAYEGPVLKAITGCTISMEGKSSACAHFSHVGNIASASCDLWSNESVQNVQLLSGFAPEVFTEILAYDCRLMNQALATGHEESLQKMFVDSDVDGSVHALVISPESSIEIAQAIISESTDFQRTRSAGLKACELIRDAIGGNRLALHKRELDWLHRIEAELKASDREEEVLAEALVNYAGAFLPDEYGI